MLCAAIQQAQAGVEKDPLPVSLARFAQNAPAIFPDDYAAQRAIGATLSNYIEKNTSDARTLKMIAPNLHMPADTSDEDAARAQQAVFSTIAGP